MKPKKLLEAIRAHPLIDLLLTVRGNPRTLILIEPCWGIPYNLIAPFATLYMVAMGVTDVQIGLILSVSMVVQVLFSFGGGIISDKLGRKTTTVLGDLLGWGVACLIWAFSQNFWWFLIAVLLNSFEQVNQTAWQCLLIEDTEQKHLLNIYTWITIGGLLAVFFAPISGALIKEFTLVPVVRVLYFTYAVSMLLKSWITLRSTTETRQGMIRREQTKGVSVWTMVLEYRKLLPMIFRNKATVQTLAVMVIAHITTMINTNFFGLFVHTRLGISEQYLAVFPILRAVVMLLFLFGIQHRLEKLPIKIPMQVGLLIYIVCQLLLLFAPEGRLLPLALFILLEATAHALVMPRKDSMFAMNVNPQERARIMALMTAFMIGFSSPFGYFAGLLSSVDRRLPFVMSIVLYAAAVFVVAFLRGKKPETEECEA